MSEQKISWAKLLEVPIHPIIFALIPTLHLYSSNPSLISVENIWRPLAATLGLAIALLLIGFLIIKRDIAKGAAFASSLLVLLFCYQGVSQIITSLGYRQFSTIGYALVSVVLIGFLIWITRESKAFNLFSLVVLAMQVGTCVSNGIQASAINRQVVANGKSGPTAKELPDIFYIILDGYGRSDQLHEKIGFDNSQFIAGLKLKGFYVADQAHSNYCQTELSLASSLNYDFIPNLLKDVPRDYGFRSPLDDLISKNRLSTRLGEAGYQTITITTGFPAIRFKGTNLGQDNPRGFNILESALLDMTPFAAERNYNESMFFVRQKLINGAFETLQNLGGHAIRPRFIFAHILAPHPPFVFGPNGESRRPKGSFTFYDGSDYLSSGGTKEDYRSGYSAQAQYLSSIALKTLEHILSIPGRKPIIIIQGDHGSKLGLSQNSLKETDLDECMSNLNAYYFPPDLKHKLYPSITPVNSFRIILSGLLGDDLPLRPDASWFSPFAKPFEFTDVTKSLKHGSNLLPE